MTDNVPEARIAARREETKKSIEKLGERLLDLSNRNRLLNFRFSDRSRTHVRVIDELPDVLYYKLIDGKRLTFAALPELRDEPQDEKSDEFLAALQAARRRMRHTSVRLMTWTKKVMMHLQYKGLSGTSKIGSAHSSAYHRAQPARA